MQPETFLNIRYKFSRRRYGTGASTRFFTWLEYRTPTTPAHEWETYGDPWPKVKLNKKELNEALHNIVANTLNVGDSIRLESGRIARVVEPRVGYEFGVQQLNVALTGDLANGKTYLVPSTVIVEVLQ